MQYRNLRSGGVAGVKAAARLAFMLSIIILPVIRPTPLLAAVEIVNLSPSNGYVGTTVSLVGTIETGNGTYRVHWDTDNGTILKSGTASQNNVSTSFTIPLSPRGVHNVFLVDASTNSTAFATFTVNPLISISPTTGAAGTVVTVTGTGFGGSETGISITWDATTPVATDIAANIRGSWISSFTTAPTATPGAHIIDAAGSVTSAALVPNVFFNVTAPRIVITPGSGIVGSTVSLSASGFFPNETNITVTYDGTPVASGLVANAGGSWTTTFNVPESASGMTHNINSYGSQTQAASIPSQAFTVLPKISINPATGTVGTTVTVTGTGFYPNETNVDISFDGVIVKNGIGTSSLGSWSNSFVVPESASGTHIVDSYSDFTLATSVSDIIFNTIPLITTSPVSGPPGTMVTVTGTGFAASETGIIVTFDGGIVKDGIAANNKGGWNVTFVVPASAGGDRKIDAYGRITPASRIPEIVFMVKACVTPNPASGIVGTKVTLTGRSFGANESEITLTYDDKPLSNGLKADSNGSWSATFTIPASVTGKHTLSAFGSITQAAVVNAAELAVNPDIAVNPTSGFVGTIVTVTGNGFAASKPITITYDGTILITTPASPVTTAQGSFNISFAAPATKGGVHKVVVTDSSSNLETEWNMDSTPPAVPGLTGSASGQLTGIFGDVPVTLDWPEITDPSGIRYVFQVDTHSDFSAPIINEQALTGNTYTTGKLAMGTYYWRVKAVDGAANESAWSTTQVVKVGLIPFWVFVIIVITGLLVIVGAIGRVVRHRHSGKTVSPAGQI